MKGVRFNLSKKIIACIITFVWLLTPVHSLSKPFFKVFGIFKEGEKVGVACVLKQASDDTTIKITRTDKPDEEIDGTVIHPTTSSDDFSVMKNVTLTPTRKWNLEPFLFKCTASSTDQTISVTWKDIVYVSPTTQQIMIKQISIPSDVDFQVHCKVTAASPQAIIDWGLLKMLYKKSNEVNRYLGDSMFETINTMTHMFHIDEYVLTPLKCFSIIRSRPLYYRLATRLKVVKIEEAPKIIIESNTYYAIEGEGVMLLCMIVSEKVRTVTWYLNDEKLNRSNGRIKDGNSPSKPHLIITNVNSSDEGIYKCSARRVIAETNGTGIHLLVKFKPRKTYINQPNTMLWTGTDKISIECISDGYPKPEMKWFLNEELVGRGPSLFIEEVFPEYGGVWQCEATNDFGSNMSPKVVAIISYVPRPLIPISIVNTGVNYSASLWCYADGIPFISSYEWRFNSRVLKETSRMITIKPMNHSDHFFGRYICKATNRIGTSKIITVKLRDWDMMDAGVFKSGYVQAFKKMTSDDEDDGSDLYFLGIILLILIIDTLIVFAIYNYRRLKSKDTGPNLEQLNELKINLFKTFDKGDAEGGSRPLEVFV